jgi:hypothetical protein
MSNFVIRSLNVLCYAAGHTHWLYNPKSLTLAECCAAGHFQDDVAMLADRDLVTLACIDGGAIRFIRIFEGRITLVPLL